MLVGVDAIGGLFSRKNGSGPLNSHSPLIYLTEHEGSIFVIYLHVEYFLSCFDFLENADRCQYACLMKLLFKDN